MGICSQVEWFDIQMPGTMVQGTWILNHLKNEQVKVRYTDVSAIQMLAIQIPELQMIIIQNNIWILVRDSDAWNHSTGHLNTKPFE